MKSNRIIWGLVSLVVLLTITVSFGTRVNFSQQDTSKKQNNKGYEDLSKYAVADYDTPEPKNATERELKKLKNKRYDSQKHFVSKNPHPETDAATLFDEVPPPSAIPIAESNLVVIGEIMNSSAHLSNTKENVYSEFTVRVEEVVKGDDSSKLVSGDSITVDRTGGYVRYPNGQKVLYIVVGKDLPKVGGQYVLFLTSDKESPNYQILTGYELKEDKVNPLDTERRFNDFKGMSNLNFKKAIRNKILEPSQPVGNQGEHHEK